LQQGYWSGPRSETRTHVGMDSSGTAAEGKLFQTQGMSFSGGADEAIELALRLNWADTTQAQADTQTQALQAALADAGQWPRFVPLGGEHRPVLASKSTAPAGWNCPENVSHALGSAQYVRMVLASPAYFQEGWKPSWLNDTGHGTPPDCEGLTLQLQAAIVPRWQAVSGWSYSKNAPKRTYRLVPAGAVYFFKVCSGSAAKLAQAWLQCVDDSQTPATPSSQTSKDETAFTDSLHGSGYGLAVWGIAQQPTQINT
jgi:CRISPR-associated protein Cmr3